LYNNNNNNNNNNNTLNNNKNNTSNNSNNNTSNNNNNNNNNTSNNNNHNTSKNNNNTSNNDIEQQQKDIEQQQQKHIEKQQQHIEQPHRTTTKRHRTTTTKQHRIITTTKTNHIKQQQKYIEQKQKYIEQQQQKHNYGSFMYLNNAGVKLLENEFYQESIETFQDATDVYHDYGSQPDQHQQRHQLSKPVQQAQSLPTNLLNERDTMLHDILIRASTRLAKIRSDKTNITLRPRDLELDPMILLDTMNDEYFTTILLFEKSIDRVDVVIRMNESLSSETNSSDWKLFYAMLIFNYSIACERTSEVTSETFSDEYQNQLRDQSRQFC
jgi:hypothetical protein